MRDNLCNNNLYNNNPHDKNHNDNSRNAQDIYLVKQVLAGDDEAFARLVDFYKHRIYRTIYQKIANKGDVEDLAQEVFIKIYKYLKRFDQTRKFSTWIYTIAGNHLIDYLRKKRLQSVSLDAPLFPTDGDKEIYLEIHDDESNPEQYLERTIEQKRIYQAIDDLPEQYSLMIKLRHIKEYTYEEIANILDLPIGTVKSRIYRARSELKKILLKKEGEQSGLSKCI